MQSPWCSGYHYYTTSFTKTWTLVLCRFKSCSRCVEDSRWWGSLKMVPAGNKAKDLLLVNHTTKIIHHHHHHHHLLCMMLMGSFKYNELNKKKNCCFCFPLRQNKKNKILDMNNFAFHKKWLFDFLSKSRGSIMWLKARDTYIHSHKKRE